MNELTEVQHCTHQSIGMSITGEDASEVTAPLDGYLYLFAAPTDGKCLKCDAQLTGILGSFMWGLVNGEGTCSSCGWPARAYHRPEETDGSEIFDRPLELILQYHPDCVDSGEDNE